ncbi:LuxR C-terminal-related transcriptional regulator [Actinacidiphila paucisporea]|uniref:Predicted ATPase n=1 Tax=Actinacidiphila paucisporea TaxID=310782 RepID=A0A1M7PLX3_9ACTN|nr:LuxR C-terminal-related transcriptional regulator [Actinacidiphila paucisporea]SHN18217.1 Predicted ATPase [Actinacidiphila paucisporea]
MTGAAAAPTNTGTTTNTGTGTGTGPGTGAKGHEGTSGLGDLLLNRMTTPAGYIGTTPTGLIGRSADLERLAAVTADPDAGLVTVTGPAGVGKSRLVMEFFRHRGTGPGGGVEVFDFAQVTDTSVAGLMLRQLREQCYEGSPAVRKALERVAAGKHTLLFDHYEDVADDLAPLLAEFRRSCPQVRIVCVGTTRLGLYGERVVRLGPLPAGDPAQDAPLSAVPAVELFVQCARAVRPEFALTAENSRFVLALCRQAGGLPLAIELAASQITLAEPDLILERFAHDPGALHRPDHHPYSRHSSVGGMVSWVLARLGTEERAQLVRLAVFQGPFTMRAAAGVLAGCHGADHRTMERLIDKSVLVPDDGHGGEVRLTIPHAVRLAAAGLLARLPAHAALRRAHAEHFRRAAAAGTGTGPETRADLLAAFDHWREAGDGGAMAVIARALREQSPTAAQALHCLRLTEEALRAGVDDPRLHAGALEAAGELALRLGAPPARAHLTRAREAHRAARDEQGAARCLALLGEEAYAAGELDRARRLFEEAYASGAGPAVIAGRQVALRLAAVLRDAGDLPRAGELAMTALGAELGRDPEGGAGALLARYVLATVRWSEHDSPQARALFADAAEQIGTLPDTAPERPECLEFLTVTLARWHRAADWQRVAATLALADHLRRRGGRPRPKHLHDRVAPVLAAAAGELTAAEYARSRRSGPDLGWQAALRLIPAEPPAPPSEASADVRSDVAATLTKRELEVALLVAEGLTNRIIARELGIAEWTVVNHLRKVMRKLGCQSRVQVTRRLSA